MFLPCSNPPVTSRSWWTSRRVTWLGPPGLRCQHSLPSWPPVPRQPRCPCYIPLSPGPWPTKRWPQLYHKLSQAMLEAHLPAGRGCTDLGGPGAACCCPCCRGLPDPQAQVTDLQSGVTSGGGRWQAQGPGPGPGGRVPALQHLSPCTMGACVLAQWMPTKPRQPRGHRKCQPWFPC